VAWSEDPKFADAAFGRIFAFTAGVPRRINNLCDRVMLYAFLEECHEIDAEVIRVVAEEIGTEFLGGDPAAKVNAAETNAAAVEPVEPLETVARVMFDKANVQQRLSAIERAVDTLGHSVKDELTVVQALLSELRLEIGALRADLEGLEQHKTVA